MTLKQIIAITFNKILYTQIQPNFCFLIFHYRVYDLIHINVQLVNFQAVQKSKLAKSPIYPPI